MRRFKKGLIAVGVLLLLAFAGIAFAGIDVTDYTPWGTGGYNSIATSNELSGYRHEVNIPHLPAVPDGCFKVQTHAHATYGVPFAAPNTSAREAIEWYYNAGFNVVFITDLNHGTPVGGLKAVYDQTAIGDDKGRFLVISGVELNFEPSWNGLIHDMMGYGGDFAGVTPPGGSTVPEVIENQVKLINMKKGLAFIPHPNLAWSVTVADILAANPRPIGMEIYNAEPGMNFYGGGGRPSAIELWDAILTQTEAPFWGVAADDSHHFSDFGLQYANPGEAWITVCTADGRLTEKGILDAIEAGSFYASTGVELTMTVDNNGVSINLSDAAADIGWSEPGANPALYMTSFIGSNGQVLATDTSLTPSYTFTGSELYVRAEVRDSDGRMAWTQPVFP